MSKIKATKDVVEGLLSRFSSSLGAEGKALAKTVSKEASDQAPTIGSKNARSFQAIKDDIARIKSEKDLLKANKYPKGFQQDELAQKPNFTMSDEIPLGVPVSDVPGQLIPTSQASLPATIARPSIKPNTLPDIDIIPQQPSKIIDATGPISNTADILASRQKAGAAALMGTAAIGTGLGMFGSEDNIETPHTPVQAKQMSQISKPEEKQTAPDAIVKAASTKKEIEEVQDKKPRQESLPKEIDQLVSAKDEELDYLEALKDAQSQERNLSILGSILKAGGALTQSVTGVKQTAGDDLEEYAKTLPTNVEAQRAMEDKNRDLNTQRELDRPNSPMAVQLREKLKKFGVNIPEGMSVTQISKATGMNMSTLIGQEENRAARHEAAASREQIAKFAADAKKESDTSKQKMEAGKSVDKVLMQIHNSEDYKSFNQANQAEALLRQALTSKDPGAKTEAGAAMMNYAKIAQGDNSVVRSSDMHVLAGSLNYTSPTEMLASISAKASGKDHLSDIDMQAMLRVLETAKKLKTENLKGRFEPVMNKIKQHGLDASEHVDPAIINKIGLGSKEESTTVGGGTIKVQRIADGVTKVMSADKASKIDTSKYRVIP